MELKTGISLIENGVLRSEGQQLWADLGSGKGLFTKALATLLKTGSMIIAIDMDRNALDTIILPHADITLKKVQGDIRSFLPEIEKLDGFLMANVLHFIPDKELLLATLADKLGSSGRIIIVEYDTDQSNPWVPYPLSYSSLQKMCAKLPFTSLSRMKTTSSAYGRAELYSALLIL